MAKRLKNLIALLVVPVLMLAFIFAGCVGEYVPPTVGGDTNITDPSNPKPDDKDPNKDPNKDPDNPDDPDPDVEDDRFIVRLVLVNKKAVRKDFTSEIEKDVVKMQAQWKDRYSSAVYRSYFNEDGIAANDKLDGDYVVTLVFPDTKVSDIFDKYTYYVNSYTADNDFRDITITLYELNIGHMATDMGVYYRLDSTGVYRTQLKSAKDKVMFQFKPSKQGDYSIETLVDVTANEINPKITVYSGSFAYINWDNPMGYGDGGGVENSYTKNVYWEYKIAGSFIGNVMWFELYSECLKSDGYPLTVDFMIQRNGDFREPYPMSTPVEVTEDFTKTPPTPAGTFEYYAIRNGGPNRELSEKEISLNKADGYYYHTYVDAHTGQVVYADRLYAKIAKPTAITDEPFTGDFTIRMLGYLVGYDETNPLNYVDFVTIYASHCNSDGCYPVTQELKEFLQTWAVSQRLFNDGNGLAERNNNDTGFPGYNSDEESQWLYACGYYA